MSAYMPLNGTPASANRWLLTRVLRETWGFKGFVGSDSGAVGSLVTQGFAADPTDAAVRALQAGLDMEMAQPFAPPAMQAVPEAVKAGRIDSAQVDEAVRRVLETKIRLGLFEHPFVDEAAARVTLDDPRRLDLARLAAERSAVLLKNDAGLLPLDRKQFRSIAVIGPLADSARDVLGPWIFLQNGPQSRSILAGLKARLGPSVRVDYAQGVSTPARIYPSVFAALEPPTPRPALDDAAEIRRAAELARNSDVAVLVLGETQDMIGENASRSSLTLPGRQQELLDAVVAAGKPVVLLLMSARPLDLGDARPAAILDIWYPGSAGAEAAADLLFGDADPGGKLPFTWIRSAAQAPNPYAHLLSHAPATADHRYWNGDSAPTYPFGYGLSYTTFRYSDLRIERQRYRRGETVVLSVDLRNTGARAGDEVAQLYIHQRYGTSARPIRELKGFQRVRLQPGESRTLRFELRPEDLRYWSAVTGGWVQDESDFDVWVGGSESADLGGRFAVRDR
jgi:beta-glucosidase